jgi:hypothetical protein
MGMDLAPLGGDPEVDGFHLNWTGWGMVGDLLQELGCNISQMAGGNDGDVVDGDVSSSWGQAIKTALAQGRIYSVYYKDDLYTSGEREEWYVEGTETPLFLRTDAVARAIVGGEDRSDLLVAPRKETLSDRGDGTGSYAYLTRVAEFFEKSGGFEQW